MKLIRLVAIAAIIFGFGAQAFAETSGLNPRSLRKLERAKKNKKGDAGAKAFEDVCKTVSPIRALIKNAYPGHIQKTDPRASGFALVCNRSDCPNSFPAQAYYSDGTPAFKLGYYGTWEGNGKPRAYCGAGGAGRCVVSKVVSDSKKSGRDGKGYIVFNKKTKSCRSFIPGKRNGSPF